MPGLIDRTVRDAASIHRLEFPFPLLYLCYAAWGACYAADALGPLFDPLVLAAIVANLLLVTSGLALNTAADVRTDERHPERGHLAAGALRFGRGRVLLWAATEMSIALLLTVWVGLASGRWLGMGAAVSIIALHLAYNIEPIRLKRRGFAGVGAFCAAVVVLPGLVSFGAVRSDLDSPVLLVLGGAGVLAVGRMTWWSLPDRAADAASGMATPSVRYGLGGALARACVIMLIGLGVVGAGLTWRYGPAWALLGIAAHAVFLLAAVLRRSTLPNSVRMRTRDLPVTTVGEAVLAVLPLVAP